MGVETALAIGIPIAIGIIGKAMSDSNQGPVDAANAKKTADMQKAAGDLQKYRPEVNQSIMRGMRGQSTAFQGANDMLATSGLPAGVPAGLNSNPMSNIFPQNKIQPSGPPPQGAPPIPVMPSDLTKPTPEAMASKTSASAPGQPMKSPSQVGDALKIRAALGDFKPGNVAPTLGPQNPIGPDPDPFAAALKGPR